MILPSLLRKIMDPETLAAVSEADVSLDCVWVVG